MVSTCHIEEICPLFDTQAFSVLGKSFKELDTLSTPKPLDALGDLGFYFPKMGQR